jgi:hypothetical protein
MQDRLAEAEGAVMLGSTAAKDLQPRKNDLHTFMHCQSLLSKDHEHKVCFVILCYLFFFFISKEKSPAFSSLPCLHMYFATESTT